MNEMQGLQGLIPILEVKRQKAQAKLASVLATEQRLKVQLTGLDKTRASLDLDPASPARKAGADIKWQRWSDQRREEINTELANLAARKIALLKETAISVGRQDAVESLLNDVRKEEIRLRDSREVYK